MLAYISLYILHTYLSTNFHAKTEFNACFFKTQKDNGQDIYIGPQEVTTSSNNFPPCLEFPPENGERMRQSYLGNVIQILDEDLCHCVPFLQGEIPDTIYMSFWMTKLEVLRERRDRTACRSHEFVGDVLNAA